VASVVLLTGREKFDLLSAISIPGSFLGTNIQPSNSFAAKGVEKDFQINSIIEILFSPSIVGTMTSKELEETYDEYSQSVYRLALTLLRNHSAAEDLAHDVFIRYWTSNKYNRERGSKLSYLLMLTRSMALNRLKQSTNRKNILLKWIDYFHSTNQKTEAFLQGQETSLKIQVALSQLTDIQRQVIELCYIDGNSHKKAAAKLSLPLGTVKTHARRGLMAMRANLERKNLGNDS